MGPYVFPMPAIKNCHKHRGLTQQKFILSQLRRQKSEIKVWAKLCSRGDFLACLFQHLWAFLDSLSLSSHDLLCLVTQCVY